MAKYGAWIKIPTKKLGKVPQDLREHVDLLLFHLEETRKALVQEKKADGIVVSLEIHMIPPHTLSWEAEIV
jgi:hypothetical protein